MTASGCSVPRPVGSDLRFGIGGTVAIGAITLLFAPTSGCVETGNGPAASSQRSEDEKAEAVRIALDNTTVSEYLSVLCCTNAIRTTPGQYPGGGQMNENIAVLEGGR